VFGGVDDLPPWLGRKHLARTDLKFYRPRVLGRAFAGCNRLCKTRCEKPANGHRLASQPQPVAELGEHPAGAVARLGEGVTGLREPGRVERQQVEHDDAQRGEREQRKQDGEGDHHGGIVEGPGAAYSNRSASSRSASASSSPVVRVASSVRIRPGSAAASAA